MAAFVKPDDAIRAALAMQRRLAAFNDQRGAGRDLVLKIGLHRGPSIVVTLNDNLDYFGHTVNVAARVQALADADQIFVTDELYKSGEVARLAPSLESRAVRLRGIRSDTLVHRVG
jgi:class 3 adenylate cyclase